MRLVSSNPYSTPQQQTMDITARTSMQPASPSYNQPAQRFRSLASTTTPRRSRRTTTRIDPAHHRNNKSFPSQERETLPTALPSPRQRFPSRVLPCSRVPLPSHPPFSPSASLRHIYSTYIGQDICNAIGGCGGVQRPAYLSARRPKGMDGLAAGGRIWVPRCGWGGAPVPSTAPAVHSGRRTLVR